MKISKNINKDRRKQKVKNLFNKTITYVLTYTIFLPYTICYKSKNKIEKKQYDYVIKNKEKYKEKVLKEILNYMTKKDIPKTVNRKCKSGKYVTKEYLIYKDGRSNYGDIFGDFHLKDFISIWSYGEKHNKKAMKYYSACKVRREAIEYDWFMNKIEKHFKLFKDIKVERGSQKIWGTEYEYILLRIEQKSL